MSIKSKLKNFFTVDEEYEYIEEYDPSTNVTRTEQEKSNIVNLSKIQQPTSKVVLCEPRTYSETQEIADHVVNRRAVVINLQRVDHTQRKRIVDFLSGTVYAVNGEIQKLGSETFLCTPDNIDVTGTITNSLEAEDDFEKRW